MACLLCLLLGAVTTVAVAWGIAWIDFNGRSGIEQRSWIRLDRLGAQANRYLALQLNESSGSLVTRVTIGPIENAPHSPASRQSPLELLPMWCQNRITKSPALAAAARNERDVIKCDATGWPMLCLWCEPAPIFPFLGPPAAGGLVINRAGDPVTLPYRPIPLGILINTIFYACIWVILLVLFRIATQTRRNKRGHCPYCNYDLRNKLDRGCPECGWRRAS